MYWEKLFSLVLMIHKYLGKEKKCSLCFWSLPLSVCHLHPCNFGTENDQEGKKRR